MATSKTPEAAQVAQRLGMKPGEIIDVQLDADGVLAQTHDGNWTLIRNDGELEFRAKDPGTAVEPIKAAKGRSRA